MAARHGGEQRTAHATNGANRDAAAGDATISPRSVSAVQFWGMLQAKGHVGRNKSTCKSSKFFVHGDSSTWI